MRKCIVQYETDENGETRWRCRTFLMSRGVSFAEDVEKCYHFRCPGRSPRIRQCRWKDCDKPIAPPKHNHCSEVCRKRDFRHAYKMRQKAKKNVQQESSS